MSNSDKKIKKQQVGQEFNNLGENSPEIASGAMAEVIPASIRVAEKEVFIATNFFKRMLRAFYTDQQGALNSGTEVELLFNQETGGFLYAFMNQKKGINHKEQLKIRNFLGEIDVHNHGHVDINLKDMSVGIKTIDKTIKFFKILTAEVTGHTSYQKFVDAFSNHNLQQRFQMTNHPQENLDEVDYADYDINSILKILDNINRRGTTHEMFIDDNKNFTKINCEYHIN